MSRLRFLSVTAVVLALVAVALYAPRLSRQLAQVQTSGQLIGFGSFTMHSVPAQGASPNGAARGVIMFTTQDGARRVEWSNVRWSSQDPRDGSKRIFSSWWGTLSRIQWENAADSTIRSVTFNRLGVPDELTLVAYGPGGEIIRSATYAPAQPRLRWSGSCALDASCSLPADAMSGSGIVVAVVPGGGSETAVEVQKWEFGGRAQTVSFPQQQKSYAYNWANSTVSEVITGTGTIRMMRWVDAVQAEGGSGSRVKVIGNTYAYPGDVREWVRLPSGTGMILRVAYPKAGPLVVSTDDPDMQAIRATQGTTAMFRAAIDKVRRTKASVLRVASGTYVMDLPPSATVGGFIELSRLQDVTVEGENSLIVFQGLNRSGIVVRNSDRVHVKNLRIDWADRLAAHAVVRHQSGATFLLVDDPAVPPGSAPATDYTIVAGFNRAANTWKTGDILNGPGADFHVSFASRLSSSGSIDYLGTGPDGRHRYGVTSRQSVMEKFNAIPGGTEMLLIRRANGVYALGVLGGSNDVTIEAVTVYASPSAAFVANSAGRGIRLVKSVVTRMPGRPYSALADGFIHNSRGEVFMEGNRFDSNGDDGFNVNGYYPVITGVDASRTVLQSDFEGSSITWGTGGDLMSFSDRRTLAPVGFARLVRALEPGVSGCPGTSGICFVIDRPLPPEAGSGGFLALNADRSTKRFIVRDNRVMRNRGRFMLVQSEQGLIENNVGIAHEMGGIFLINDVAYWMNGPGPSDVIVRNNTFENVGFGTHVDQRSSQTDSNTGYEPNAVILMMSRVPVDPTVGHGIGMRRQFRNILIERNVIRRTPGLGMVLESGSDVVVRENVMIDTNTVRFPAGSFATGAVMVMYASDVTFLDNAFSGQIFVDPRTTDGITVDGVLRP